MSSSNGASIATVEDALAEGDPAGSRLNAKSRVLLVVAAASVLSVSVAGWLVILWRAIAARAGRYDFSHYYAAARALHLDPHANIYSMAVLSASAAASHVVAPTTIPYLYPPLLALLLIPLTAFSFPVAADIFFVVNVLVWLLSTLLIAREVYQLLGESLAARQHVPASGALARLLANPTPVVALAICAPLFFLGRPSVATLGNGQINFVVLLPLACIPWLTRRGSERGVGVAVAIATMLKLTPVVLLLYLLLRRRWRALGAALLSLAVLAGICLVIVGPHVFFAYPATVLQTGGENASLAINEALFAPALQALASANPALAPVVRICEYVLLGVLGVELGIILWRSRPRGAIHLSVDVVRREALAYAMALCAVVLLSPAVWAHHYVWLLPPAAIVLALAIRAVALQPEHARRRWVPPVLLIGGIVGGILLDVPLPNGWDTDPTVSGLLFGLPLRPWFQELRPLGGLLVVVIAATMLLQLLRSESSSIPRIASWIRQKPRTQIPAPLRASRR